MRSVKKALKTLSSGTKNSVARMTGLSIATCNTILNELAETGEIMEVENTTASFGRPPKTYRFNESFTYICCVFPTRTAGRWRIDYAITDLLGNILREDYRECDAVTADEIAEMLQELIEKEPKIKTVSFGNPGFYYDHCIHSCGVVELEGCDLVEVLRARLGCNIYIENDMNAIAYGVYYHDFEDLREEKSLVMLAYFEGERIGSGTILDGKILHGNTGFAGEIAKLNYHGVSAEDLVSSGRDGTVRAISIASLFCSERLNEKELVQILKKAKEAGAVTIADLVLNRKDSFLDELKEALGYLDYIVPSLDEAKYFSKKESLQEIAEVFHGYGIENVVIKLGKDGVYADTPEEKVFKKLRMP